MIEATGTQARNEDIDKLIAFAQRHAEQVGKRELERLLNIATGCHDYNGGHRDEYDNQIFHYGVQTVVNALRAAARGESNDYQVDVLEVVGRQMRRAELEALEREEAGK